MRIDKQMANAVRTSLLHARERKKSTVEGGGKTPVTQACTERPFRLTHETSYGLSRNAKVMTKKKKKRMYP